MTADDKVGTGLVIGGGVGGIRAALDLAESGYRAYLVDSSPGIGGTVPKLDKWFPDNQCELCKLLPVFDRDDCAQLCLRPALSAPRPRPPQRRGDRQLVRREGDRQGG